MSCHYIYIEDGVKKMRPIHSREEYMQLRDTAEQKSILAAVRGGNEALKNRLVQFNYSCLPNDDGTLKGSKRISTTVAMDIDHVPPQEMQPLKERILAHKEELGLLMLEESARGQGYHFVFTRRPDLDQEANLEWAAQLLSVDYDDGAKDITRVFFTTPAAQLICLDDAIFAQQEFLGTDERSFINKDTALSAEKSSVSQNESRVNPCQKEFPTSFKGIPYAEIIAEYWRSTGGEPNTGERNKRLHKLAANLRAICDDQEEWLLEVMPRYGLSLQEMKSIIHSACKEPTKGSHVMDQIIDHLSLTIDHSDNDLDENEEENVQSSMVKVQWKRLPQGIRDSIDAVGTKLAMPVITAICPCIGALATGVVLDVHGRKKGLNLISYIAGDFASGKGDIDPVVDAWMSEVQALDKMYQMQEDEWRAKKRAAKNKKEQPEEPKLPVRCLTLNNTVANLAERLGNTEGKHAFSFTPEADTVAQKWKSSMSDFSVMLRQSYDGTRYDREARSADAVNVHIERLLWNVTMCGTPDALYRVVNNYTDGFQSRIAIGRTPDNTFAKLEDKPNVLTSRQTERIQQIAHLLPLMQGEVVLPKLEARGREWLERIRIETMKNDDKVRARQRFRVCVTAQRMVCCLMLCKVCEGLIQKHGLNGAETHLKQNPLLWKELLLKAQTPQLLETYDMIADSLLENALYFFRDRIENAFASRNYAGNLSGERLKRGKNDSIFERLDVQFSFEQAMQFSVAMKGASVTHNSVRQMLKNWRNQGLVSQTPEGGYRKMS